jgi:hypothetical protein
LDEAGERSALVLETIYDKQLQKSGVAKLVSSTGVCFRSNVALLAEHDRTEKCERSSMHLPCAADAIDIAKSPER